MRTSIILFLNKVDIFKQKLGRSPLGNYFQDYSGGNDVNKAAKYLLWRFNQVNRAHLNLYPQYVTRSLAHPPLRVICHNAEVPCLPWLVLTNVVVASRKRLIRQISGSSLLPSKRPYSTMR